MKRFTAFLFSAVLLLIFISGCGTKSEVSLPERFPLGAGMLRSFAIDESGGAYYWGIDFGTEDTLGTEDLSTVQEHLVTEPRLVTNDVSSVFATDSSALFLKEDRSLWLLGTPAITGDFCAPEPVLLMESAVSADLSGTDILAVSDDGALWSFKKSLTEPEKLMDGISFVSAGSGTWLAIGTDGRLWERGKEDAVMKDTVMAAAGSRTSAAVKKDGSLWVWGEYGGQKPEKIAGDVIYVAAGESSQYSSCIMYITGDNALWVLGYDPRSGESYDKPEKIMDGAAAVSIYGNLVLAAKTDGTVEGWGDNSMGGLCSTELEASGPVTIPVPKI